MARTGKALPPEFVRKWIYESAAQEQVALDEKKINIIDSILATLLPKPNPTWIATWCNRDVSRILASYPEYQAEATILRLQVKKEILYFLNEDEFKRLAQLLVEQKIKKPEPNWIRGESYGLYLAIKRGFRTRDNKIDWQFIFDRLGTKKFSYRNPQSYLGDKNKIIFCLRALLEKEDPIVFNPAWITRKSGSLIKQIDIVFKNDWPNVVSLLGDKWISRFTHQNIPKNIKFYKGTAEFRTFIKKHRVNLYVLYAAPSNKEKGVRNQLAMELVQLSQKGNQLAFDFLVDGLMLTIQVNNSFVAWTGFDSILRDKIRSCVFLFDERRGVNFFNYLYTALLRAILPIKGVNSFSLNGCIKNGKSEISEFLVGQLVEDDDFMDNIRLVIAR